jgi:hypothetical protein
MQFVYTRERNHIGTNQGSLALLFCWLLLNVLEVKFLKILKVVGT